MNAWAIGSAVWAVCTAVAVVVIAAAKRRDKRAEGRELLARMGMADYRVGNGPDKGRWMSEIIAEDIDSGYIDGGYAG